MDKLNARDRGFVRNRFDFDRISRHDLVPVSRLRFNSLGNGDTLMSCLPLILFASILVIFAASALSAQTSSTGALTGTVRDPSGAVVPNAKVTATSSSTGQARSVTTSADGTYTM